jgi:hypothetical protein
MKSLVHLGLYRKYILGIADMVLQSCRHLVERLVNLGNILL